DVVMTSTYTGRIADAHRAGRNLALVWPGSLYGMDYWAVVKGSKRGAEARRFIAFANAPDAQVRYVENIPYGPTNRQAAQRLPAQLASWVPTAPANLEQGLAMDDEFWVEHGEELEERFNAWASQ
ncbi:extracellular solute-binding protein, partial [Gramella aestuarii]